MHQFDKCNIISSIEYTMMKVKCKIGHIQILITKLTNNYDTFTMDLRLQLQLLLRLQLRYHYNHFILFIQICINVFHQQVSKI